MLKRIFSILIACVLLSMSVSALADPIVSDGEYTAYLGENNNLFLIDPTGSAKVLRSTIIDLVGMDTENLFCLTAEGRLYAILLDGSSTAIVSAAPTDEDIETHRGYVPYRLDSNLLTLTNPEAGTDGLISTAAIAACSNGVDVFYIESDSKGILKSVPANGSEAPEDIAYAAEHPVSMHASADSVAIVTDDQSVIVISLDDGARYPFPAIAETVTDAVSINGTLFRYAATDRGYMLVSEESNGIAVSATQTDLSSTKTNATTAPQATSYPVVTAQPTARPTPRPTAHHYVDDGSISYGARGSEVKKMQTRLIALGYPVDTADGRFGPITLVAVKCFQHAIGYRERSTATYSMLQKLYAKDAPVFNACEPVVPGARGIHVTLLQEALKALGFDPGKIDGRYGDMTKAAVAAYQQSVGLTATGIADTTTLMYLYQKLPDPTATPTAVPTPSSTPAPTVVPTAAPTAQPTDTPTEVPTEEPTEPTATPTAVPTEEPTPTATPTATPAPTEDPATTTDL